MSAKERQKKPKLERDAPVRRWTTLFAVPPAEEAMAAIAPAATAAPPQADEVITHSVELGYRVIDEYVRRGQRAARLLSQPVTNPQAVTGDLQRLFAEHLSQLTRFWIDAFQLATTTPFGPTAPSPAPERPAAEAPAAAAAGGAESEPAVVRLEVAAHQPTQVALELRPDAARRTLVVHALRAVEGDKPRLSGVVFRPATTNEPASLRIVVPAGHPAGTYSGLLVDEATNRPVGTLSVDVSSA